MKIGIYCTVRSGEIRHALASLSYAGLSAHVFNIAILITDRAPDKPRKLTPKITLYSHNFGSGYSISVTDGGYDQIAARNFLLERFTDTDVDWLMMHDADDIYLHDYYDFISEKCITADAITCSCFSLRPGPEICIPQGKTWYIQGKTLYDPHTRIWKKNLNLRYEKSAGIEKHFANHSRHCGVIFPEDMNIISTDGVYHFHLHALLNKRHTEKISAYSRQCILLPESIDHYLKKNNQLFSLR
ncbi:hypothetical protein [Raoultella planticola]|uniref:hypothetical protein n=1 Tax=Raoultella planticola TaxID=575 RepID=UPI0011866426|nr:hypothetical protein [Raoultella planticola]